MSQIRGVFILDFVSETGFPLAVAVKGDGSRLCEREVYPFETEEEVVELLWDMLDREDPQMREDVAA